MHQTVASQTVARKPSHKGIVAEIILALMILTLAACGGSKTQTHEDGNIPPVVESGGGSGGGGGGGGGGTSNRSVGGGGIKGPLVDAIVTVYDIDTTNVSGNFKGVVVTTATTDSQAQIVGLALPFPFTQAYILEFTSDSNTTDIYTGLPPVITTMRTVLTLDLLNSGEQLYATPLTTMAVDLAALNADNDAAPWDVRDLDANDDGTDDITVTLGDGTATLDEFLTALDVAAGQVKSTMGFGISQDIDIFDTPPLIDSTTTTPEAQEDAAAYRAAVEALTAVVSQIDSATGTEDPNAVLAALTSDLADGEIDGKVDGVTSDIYDGEDDTAGAALELFEQDPTTLPIPNDPLGRTVGEMKEILDAEKADLGNDSITTEIDITEEVELKPAETDPDLDDDGVPNDFDAFPEDQRYSDDNDQDGIPDVGYTVVVAGGVITRTADASIPQDLDDDNDGVADVDDDFPLDASEQTDTDGDGVGNNADTDDDGDGVADSADDFPLDNTKSDLTDVDGDGWPSDQDSNDNDAAVPGGTFVDTDGDGVGDTTDTDDDNDGVLDVDDAFTTDATEQKDQDGDGIGDNTDTDIDGDGVANVDDRFPRNPYETIDTDRDGIGNTADLDDDGDGIEDLFEVQGNRSDPLKRDTDGDGVLDNVDQAPRDPSIQFDSDDDGVDNLTDNCPVHFNPLQANADGDERGDACDKDRDGDGTDNVNDAFPDDDTETTDTDNDGIGNNADLDDDGDGVLDTNDAFPTDGDETVDTDSDGIGNNEDTDDDGDGIEDSSDAFPLDNTETTDTDGDGIGNNADTDDDGDGIADGVDAFPLLAEASTDTDGDGIPNITDADDDGDGVNDVDDAFPLNPNETIDSDNDGVGNNTDTDDDNDGVPDTEDAFPTNPNEYLDSDGDGTGNNSDADDDGDGVADSADAFPLDPQESLDTDGDGIGNSVDDDDDNDGVSDTQEGIDGTNPLVVDTDGDGRKDAVDNCPITVNASQFDRDGDGLGDACDTDDDGDTVADGTDNCPLVPNTDQMNQDGDSEGDLCDTDLDGDGADNQVDNCPATVNADQADANNNGIGDACDQDQDSDTIVDTLDNCPTIANLDQLDTDHDGQGNVCDDDDDNDGLSDVAEASAGSNPLLEDSDDDGVPDALDAFPTDATEILDTDGDGIGDNADTDGDNDTVDDATDNCPTVPNTDQLNTDNDAFGNACDLDDDNDGVNDDFDAAPLDATISKDEDSDGVGDKDDNCPVEPNANQDDMDNDGIGDACDHDADGDGIGEVAGSATGAVEDNCPSVANPSQIDTDSDGDGDACDTDDDNDSTLDAADNCPLISNDQTDTDSDGLGDECDNDIDGDGLTNLEENAKGSDPLLVNTDSDGEDDGTDNCPVIANDQTDTDSDGVGDACDLDDDNDGVLDAADEFPIDSTESSDIDGDGVGDNADNCPSIVNDQTDTDGDGIGDVCDGVPVLSKFYLNERIVDTETETDDSGTGLCPFDAGDEMTRVSLWLQEGGQAMVSFGDGRLGGNQSGPVGIDASGNVTGFRNETFSNDDGSQVTFDLSYVGTHDDSTKVISGITTETFTFESSAGVEVATCTYSSTETFTPMPQTAASDVFDGGTNGGFVWMDADEDRSNMSNETAFEFYYGLIDILGEKEYQFDASATGNKWPLVTDTSSNFMLGASGWVVAADQFVVEGTPASTLNLVSKDAGGTILANWSVTPYTSNATAEPMLGLVPREWSDEGLTTPEAVFAGTDVLAVAIHAVSQLDVYEVRCDGQGGPDDNFPGYNLDCQNVMVASWPEPTSPDEMTDPVLATTLSDVIHATGDVMMHDWQGVRVGFREGAELVAFLTGSDTSGAEASTGTVTYYERDWNFGTFVQVPIAAGTWTVLDPNNDDTSLVLQFSLSDAVRENYHVDDESDAIVLAIIDDTSNSVPYVRVGRFTAAGVNFYESGLNVPGIDEVKANFDYTPPVPDTDGDGLPDDEDTDDDNDGTPDTLDAFPLDPNETVDTDMDGIGNNADDDDDGDTVSDADEEALGTDPLLADTDSDGEDDANDNCPTIPNADQADADGNGVGDVCDGVPDISGFWKLEAEVIGAVENLDLFTGSTEQAEDLCETTVGETFSTLVRINQKDSVIELLLGDENFDQDERFFGNIDATGNFNFGEDDSWNQYDHSSSIEPIFEYSIAEMFEFQGGVDSTTAPMVITSTSVTEQVQAFSGENQTGDVILDCAYTLTASLTRVSQVDASAVLAAAGSHQGLGFVDADEDHVQDTGTIVFDFSYDIIDENGEVSFEWNDNDGLTAGVWETDVPEDNLMLGAAGWVEVPEVFVIDGTPGVTADLVRTDGTNIFSRLRFTAYATNITGEAFEGYVEEDFVDFTPDPDATFADVDAAAIGIETETMQDSFIIECDNDDPIFQSLGLVCSNAYIRDWSNYPVLSQTDLATTLADVLHPTGSQSSFADKGMPLGFGMDGSVVYAFLTGPDTSGVTGATGVVQFFAHAQDASGVYGVTTVDDAGLPLETTWEIVEPFAGNPVVRFTIPEKLFEFYDVRVEETSTVLLAVVEAGDTQGYVRFGGMIVVGEHQHHNAVNTIALNEVLAGFAYVRPDTDGDGRADNEDNCPALANADQADVDNDGVGDACQGGSGGGNDMDLDGIDDSVDNCPSVPNDDQIDSDGNGIGDACEGGTTPVACIIGDVVSGATESAFDQAVSDCGGFDRAFDLSDINDTYWWNGMELIFFDSAGDGFVQSPDFGLLAISAWSLDLGYLRYSADNSATVGASGLPATSYNRKVALMVEGSGEVSTKFFNDDLEVADIDFIASMLFEVSTGPDTDSDGFPDQWDNCPNDANPDQADSDADNIGDVCDSDVDTDLDGVDDLVDNCPSVPNSDQADNDDNGIGDACEGGGIVIADADSDGILDGDDAFPDDATEQRDTDGDGVGDNADNCQYVANGLSEDNQADTNVNGLGDACDVAGVPDMSGVYLLSFTVETADPSNQEYDEDTDSCIGVTEDAGNELVRVEQFGNQVIMFGEDQDGEWKDIGTIQPNGSFVFNGEDNSAAESFVFTGTYTSQTITGSFTDSQQTSDASATCAHLANVMGAQPTPVTASTVVAAGLSWFEADHDQDPSGMAIEEYEYGTISEGPEQIFFYNKTNDVWDDVSSQSIGSLYFVDANDGIANGDDIFVVDPAAYSSDSAVIKVTSGGNGTIEEWSNETLDLAEVDLNGLPMELFLNDFGPAFGGANFGVGAKAYVANVTPIAKTYEFWCDEDWNVWFETNLICDNVVAKGYADLDGIGGQNDPVAAVSLDEVISTPAELASPTQEVSDRAFFIGSDMDSAGNYQVQAFLQTDDGTATGTNASVVFVKNYDPSNSFVIDTVPLVSSTVGGVAILEFVVPGLVEEIADRDDDFGGVFIFVESALDSTPMVRRGEVIAMGSGEMELLFNSTATTEILAAFDPASVPMLPQSFIDASSNGINFSSGVSSDATQFGVVGMGIYREWEDSSAGTEVEAYYVFSASDSTGRYVYDEFDANTGAPVVSADEAMTWSIDVGTGNLKIIITSNNFQHEIALVSMADTMRPSMLVNIDGMVDELNVFSERMISQADFLAEVGTFVDLTSDTDVIGDYHFAFDPLEEILFNGDGSFSENEDDGSGVSVEVDSGTWVLDPSTDLITLTYTSDSALVGFEDISADTTDIDNDTDVTENVYSMVGWEELDSVTGLGSFFRDKLLLIQILP